MAGQLFVRDFEIAPRMTKLSRVCRKLGLEVKGDGALLELPFPDAVRIFAERKIVPADEFYADLDRFRGQGFTGTHLTTERLRQVAYDHLQAAIERGETLDEFADAIQSEQDALGVGALNHGYLRTVFNTNVSANYGAGRFRQLVDPDVVEQIPYRQYRATLDSRTRPEHAALHGKVWLSSDKTWHIYVGPNDFNCRCQVIGVDSFEDAQVFGIHPDDEPLPGGNPQAVSARNIQQMLDQEVTHPSTHPRYRFDMSPIALTTPEGA